MEKREAHILVHCIFINIDVVLCTLEIYENSAFYNLYNPTPPGLRFNADRLSWVQNRLHVWPILLFLPQFHLAFPPIYCNIFYRQYGNLKSMEGEKDELIREKREGEKHWGVQYSFLSLHQFYSLLPITITKHPVDLRREDLYWNILFGEELL